MIAAGLVVTMNIPAPPEMVFDALIQPDRLALWLAPGDDWTTHVHRMDPRVGGTYALTMIDPKGEPHPVVGKYRVVRRPDELEFTWRWDRPNEAETTVHIKLQRRENTTDLVLTHERLPTEAAKQRHLDGWNACLSRLIKQLETAVN
ncbi:MAG TPA: SRPBCC domain-containing protein [Candidatus Thermoplasmatota archaeon]